MTQLKIVLTADPEIPVPPIHYGGIERIVDMLAEGLAKRGHKVTLFAHPESKTSGKLIAWPGGTSRLPTDTLRNMARLSSFVANEQVDIIHSFSRLAYLTPLLPFALPKIMSYQREISPNTVQLAHRISRATLSFTAISHWMMQTVGYIGRWDMIPNGVPLDRYPFTSHVPPDAPLVFLGRIEEIKGPHLAIEIALRTGRNLIIAGNIPDEHRSWVETHVFPHVDGHQICYVGPVDDTQKSKLLGEAAAFLMPILWEEPFGIVMAEAMACGTPVLGLSRGAVPEVVQDGVTGFVRDRLDDLIALVSHVPALNRWSCRARVARLYSDTVVVDAYEALYFQRIGIGNSQSN